MPALALHEVAGVLDAYSPAQSRCSTARDLPGTRRGALGVRAES